MIERNYPVTISVVIPTYNHQNYVLKTLDSVFAQTFADYEIIVINDGSPDDTHEVLQPLVEAGKIRYVRQENAGQAAARNRGIAETKSEFVALLDDDDLWPPEKLEWQVEAMRQYPEAALIYGTIIRINEKDEVLPPPNYESMPVPEHPLGELKSVDYEVFINRCQITSPGQCLIRRSELANLGERPFDESITGGADDWDLYLRILQNYKVLSGTIPALNYRVHDLNASGNSMDFELSSLNVERKMLKTETNPTRRDLWREKYSLDASRIAWLAIRIICGRKTGPRTTIWKANILLIRYGIFVLKNFFKTFPQRCKL